MIDFDVLFREPRIVVEIHRFQDMLATESSQKLLHRLMGFRERCWESNRDGHPRFH